MRPEIGLIIAHRAEAI
jgi:hypothetical protein